MKSLFPLHLHFYIPYLCSISIVTCESPLITSNNVHTSTSCFLNTSHCLTCPKTNTGRGPELQSRRRPIHACLYDITGGERVQYLTGYCRDCRTTYTPCYFEQGHHREYYTDVEGQLLVMFQVTEHNFMSHKLASYFNYLQMLAAVSTYNLAGSYNSIHAPANNHDGTALTLSDHVCALGLDIHRLLRSANKRMVRLKIEREEDDNKDRLLLTAVEDHLEWLKSSGYPHSMYVCSNCALPCKSIINQPPQLMRAMVTDEIPISHWCCSISAEQLRLLHPQSNAQHCTLPLDEVTDRYCPQHTLLLHDIWVAQPCTVRVRPVNLNTSIVSSTHHDQLLRNTCALIIGRHSLFHSLAVTPAPLTAPAPNPNRIMLSRKRTHHEQLMVSTCGLIMGRQTSFTSGSVENVKEFIVEIFKEDLPTLMFYRNACQLYSHIRLHPQDAHRFRNMIMPDVAHQTGPHNGPQRPYYLDHHANHLLAGLKTPNGGWRFNSETTQSINAWVGTFAPMCRHMHSTKYNFFLEEMIRLRNELTLNKIYANS